MENQIILGKRSNFSIFSWEVQDALKHDSIAFLVYLALKRFADFNTGENCYVSDARAAELAGVSVRTFIRKRKVLEDLGWISVESGKSSGKTNTYKVHETKSGVGYDPKSEGGVTESHTGYDTESQGVCHRVTPGYDTVSYNQETLLTRDIDQETTTNKKRASKNPKPLELNITEEPIPVNKARLAPALSSTNNKSSARELALNREHEFPYDKVSVTTSAIWYWMIARFKLHDLDTKINRATFIKWTTQYLRNIPEFIGKEWVDQKDYIDWYLSQTDSFISKKCEWGIEYLVSLSCVNQYINSKKPFGFISNQEERDKNKGRWFKNE